MILHIYIYLSKIGKCFNLVYQKRSSQIVHVKHNYIIYTSTEIIDVCKVFKFESTTYQSGI